MGTGDGVADAVNLAGSVSKDFYREPNLRRHGSEYGFGSSSGFSRQRNRRRERVRLQAAHPSTTGQDDGIGPGQNPRPGSSLNVAFSLVRRVSAKVSNVGSRKPEHPLKRRASRRARGMSSIRRPRRQTTNNKLESSLARRHDAFDEEDQAELQSNLLVVQTDQETGNSKTSFDNSSGLRQSFVSIFQNGWRQLQIMVGLRKKDAVSVQEISVREPFMEDFEMPHRYRPENLKLLCRATGFTVPEMKRIYRGFKTECPTGLITEEVFHTIYARFFPNGAHFLWKDLRGRTRSSLRSINPKQTRRERKDAQSSQANISSYPHYVFSTLDHDDSGVITFGDFVVGLSILLLGSVEEKLRWIFTLYDQDRDGYISREEMEDVVGSVFDLVGRTTDPILEEEVINERVNYIFQRMDLNGDGIVSLDEFLHVCFEDESISRSITAFANFSI